MHGREQPPSTASPRSTSSISSGPGIPNEMSTPRRCLHAGQKNRAGDTPPVDCIAKMRSSVRVALP